MMMFCISNSARNESSVVKLPGPAIKGKANGKTVAVIPSPSSSLYKVMPKIISSAIKNKIKAPATAKEFTSIPISDNKLFPKNKKTIMITPAITDAFSDWIWPDFFLKSMTIGIFPMISMTAKSTIKAVKISLIFIPIVRLTCCCKISKHHSLSTIKVEKKYCIFIICFN